MPSLKFSLTVSDIESIIKVSSPAPPISTSFPTPPLRVLFEEFPVIISFPEPPTAFSIIVPAEIIRLPVRPPMFEGYSELEFFSVDLKSMTWLFENPLKSRVSTPLPSAMVNAVESIKLGNSEKIWLEEIWILVLNPYVVSPEKELLNENPWGPYRSSKAIKSIALKVLKKA